jgi:hypothetical protein
LLKRLSDQTGLKDLTEWVVNRNRLKHPSESVMELIELKYLSELVANFGIPVGSEEGMTQEEGFPGAVSGQSRLSHSMNSFGETIEDEEVVAEYRMRRIQVVDLLRLDRGLEEV